jgi:hypothetical protein
VVEIGITAKAPAGLDIFYAIPFGFPNISAHTIALCKGLRFSSLAGKPFRGLCFSGAGTKVCSFFPGDAEPAAGGDSGTRDVLALPENASNRG